MALDFLKLGKTLLGSAALCVLVAGARAGAQEGNGFARGAPLSVLCNPSSHEHDAVAAAPASHRVLFEDEHVRVLEIVLPPLSVEPVHVHMLPSVISGETGGDGGARFVYSEYHMAGGEWELTSSNEVEPTPGHRSVWTPAEGPHSIANVGPVPVRFLRTEIKPEACAQ